MIDYQNIFQRNIEFWGEKVHNCLQQSTILIAGCGGLGSVVSQNLVRSGIGGLVLIDFDKIEYSNLNRQFLYNLDDIGKNKAIVTKQKLEKINPFCEITTIEERLSLETDLTKFKVSGFADCLDNYQSRYILESKLGKNFLVHGGVSRDFGQVTTIKKNKTKSLLDIFQGTKENKAKGISPQIVNIVGSIMADEIINCLIGKPKLLNKILVFELADYSIEFINLK